jgi:hypothetical protein
MHACVGAGWVVPGAIIWLRSYKSVQNQPAVFLSLQPPPTDPARPSRARRGASVRHVAGEAAPGEQGHGHGQWRRRTLSTPCCRDHRTEPAQQQRQQQRWRRKRWGCGGGRHGHVPRGFSARRPGLVDRQQRGLGATLPATTSSAGVFHRHAVLPPLLLRLPHRPAPAPRTTAHRNAGPVPGAGRVPAHLVPPQDQADRGAARAVPERHRDGLDPPRGVAF